MGSARVRHLLDLIAGTGKTPPPTEMVTTVSQWPSFMSSTACAGAAVIPSVNIMAHIAYIIASTSVVRRVARAASVSQRSRHSPHSGFDTAIGVQAQPSVSRRSRIDETTLRMRRELHAGGRRAEQTNATSIGVEFLMDMDPHHAAHLRKGIDYVKKLLAVRKTHRIHPRAAYRDGRVMQGDQRMPLGATLQAVTQPRQHAHRQTARSQTHHRAVEQNHLPATPEPLPRVT